MKPDRPAKKYQKALERFWLAWVLCVENGQKTPEPNWMLGLTLVT
jgi:hypothetical protein